jgi:pimeloyl-ACP methyl ester carboxylesterase
MRRIIYLHGFASGPQSRKAQFFRDRLAELGIVLESPDLTTGDFENLTIAGQFSVLERVAAGEGVTLIGSSLGGYLAALYAARHPETERVLLLAPAFAFNQRWEALMGPEAFATWRSTGKLSVYHYAEERQRDLSLRIYEESQGCDPYPAFSQPAQIYHGRLDTVVPPEISERYAAAHGNVDLTLLDSDHGLMDALPEIWHGASGFLLGG